jgi:hypothetical protein
MKSALNNLQNDFLREFFSRENRFYLTGGAAELVVVIPITSKAKGIPLHVEVTPPEGGLTMTSFVNLPRVWLDASAKFPHRLSRMLKTGYGSYWDFKV